jgi:cytochrome c peroxidase
MWQKAYVAMAAVIAGCAYAAPADWTLDELAILRGLSVEALGAPPADPSNRVADNPLAAGLGKSLFFDARLSSNGRVSCASCHKPDHDFTDDTPTGQGVGSGTRRTMPVTQAVYSQWLFWDGRADSLWAQALGPVENPLEHNFTRMETARIIATHYRNGYEALFGRLPNLADQRRFPLRASPVGDRQAVAAWKGMAADDRVAVDRVFANFGKAIAAFERSLRVTPTRLDRYLAGLTHGTKPAPLSTDETAGLKLFIGKARCILCHSGPMLSNGGFANTGVPARVGLPVDNGRLDGAPKALADPFNCKGRFSDAASNGCDELEFIAVNDPHQLRAYKVPSLRNVAARPPYMHAGQFKTLAEVIDHYNRAPRAPAGHSELKPLHLSKREQAQLLAFLHTLDGPKGSAH